MPEKTPTGITRQQAWELLNQKVGSVNLIRHCLASEAIMRALAERLGKDVEQWGIAGLLHDLDFEQTRDEPSRHGLMAALVLAKRGVSPEIVRAVKSHNEETGTRRQTLLDFALASAETITGLIVAAALVHPGKELSQVKVKSVLKKMKQKEFARNVDRQIILECKNLGLSLEEFVQISLRAMQAISDQLGL
ncbi:MAG: HDIG domain-containing protein [Candidatus Latescibacteria bacterium]|nr:HDIG domain-containing protein [Candidatus Latescibacterota bacterium]